LLVLYTADTIFLIVQSGDCWVRYWTRLFLYAIDAAWIPYLSKFYQYECYYFFINYWFFCKFI